MILVIMSGVSGSGKTTRALEIQGKNVKNVKIVSADDYFVGEDGVYRFDADQLAQAHATCYSLARLYMHRGVQTIIVDNTSCSGWERDKWREMAEEFGYTAMVEQTHGANLTDEDIALFASRNRHGVTEDIIRRQYNNFKSGYEKAPGKVEDE